MKRIGWAILATTLMTVSPCLAGQEQYRFRVVDFPGAAKTQIYAVNDLGQYVGASFDSSLAPHAIYFDGRNLIALDPNGVVGQSPQSHAYSLNNRGQIAGSYQDSAGVLHGYVYLGGKVTPVNYPDGSPTEAFGINDCGEVIGVYYDTAGTPHAFVLLDGVYKPADLPDGVLTVPLSVNDWSEIVGEFADVSGTVGHGYREWSNGKVTTYDAPGAPPNSTYFISINNGNQILGGYFDAAGNFHNFLITNGKVKPFNVPSSYGAAFVSAQTINDRGEIVGFYTDAQSVDHGFIAVPEDSSQAPVN